MDNEHPDSDAELQRRLDELSERVAATRADIDQLQARVNAANHRADVSEARADASEGRAHADRDRIDKVEERLDIDERILAELQADGLLQQQNEAHLKEALSSSCRGHTTSPRPSHAASRVRSNAW